MQVLNASGSAEVYPHPCNSGPNQKWYMDGLFLKSRKDDKCSSTLTCLELIPEAWITTPPMKTSTSVIALGQTLSTLAGGRRCVLVGRSATARVSKMGGDS